MTGKSPLTGKNDPELGTRFPDMTFAYSHELGEKALQALRTAVLSCIRVYTAA